MSWKVTPERIRHVPTEIRTVRRQGKAVESQRRGSSRLCKVLWPPEVGAVVLLDRSADHADTRRKPCFQGFAALAAGLPPTNRRNRVGASDFPTSHNHHLCITSPATNFKPLKAWLSGAYFLSACELQKRPSTPVFTPSLMQKPNNRQIFGSPIARLVLLCPAVSGWVLFPNFCQTHWRFKARNPRNSKPRSERSGEA
jgi:hypothetical protein